MTNIVAIVGVSIAAAIISGYISILVINEVLQELILRSLPVTGRIRLETDVRDIHRENRDPT